MAIASTSSHPSLEDEHAHDTMDGGRRQPWQPPAAGHRALPIAAGAVRGRAGQRHAGADRRAAPLAARARWRQRVLATRAGHGLPRAAQHRRLPQRARGHHARPHGARDLRHGMDQARGGGRRLHTAARPLRHRGSCTHAGARGLCSVRLHHRRPGDCAAAARRRVRSHHAVGGADRHRPRPVEPVCAGDPARAVEGCGADRRRRPRPALACRAGDGDGLRRRAAQHRGGTGR